MISRVMAVISPEAPSTSTSTSMSTSTGAATSNVPADTERAEWRDCLACRITGSATFTGIGAYALYQAHHQGAFARVRPKGSPIVGGQVSAAIGVVMIGLGIGRLFV